MTGVAPALPSVSSAVSITYETGNFVRGKWTGFSVPFGISIVGVHNVISLHAGILRRSQSVENPEAICFSFSRGTITVKNPAGRRVFTHSLSCGLIVRKVGSVDVEIGAGLAPNTTVRDGSTGFHFSFSLLGENGYMEFGSAVVRIVPTPETMHPRAGWNRPARSRWIDTSRAQRRLVNVFNGVVFHLSGRRLGESVQTNRGGSRPCGGDDASR